jgi:hypothetical protein
VLRRVLQHPAGILFREGAAVTAEKRVNGERRFDHPFVKAYIEGRCDSFDLAWIARQRASDPVFEAFFSSVDILSGAAGKDRPCPDAEAAACQMNEIDDIISLSFCGLVTEEDAVRCLNTLALSPVYFDQFRRKVTESVQNNSVKPAFDPTALTVKSDEEILAQIRDMSGKRERSTRDVNRGFWSRLAEWAQRLGSSIGPVVRRPAFAAVAILLVAVIVWRYAFYYREGQLPESAVFNRTVPFAYDQSGLRGFDESLSDEDDVLFIRQLKLGMSDYVKGEFIQSAALFEALEPDALRLVHNPAMAAYVREFYFYWGMSRLSVIHLKKSISDHTRENLGEAANLLTLALSAAEEHRLEGTDREIFLLGLTLGLEGRKTDACVYLRKVPQGSRFLKDSRILLGLWLEKSR